MCVCVGVIKYLRSRSEIFRNVELELNKPIDKRFKLLAMFCKRNLRSSRRMAVPNEGRFLRLGAPRAPVSREFQLSSRPVTFGSFIPLTTSVGICEEI